jgi:hypothetical protein
MTIARLVIVLPRRVCGEGITKQAARHPWAWLLQRVFAVDIMTCPRCRGAMRWGASFYGQLGLGNTDDIGDNELPSSQPAIMLGATPVVEVATGSITPVFATTTGASVAGAGMSTASSATATPTTSAIMSSRSPSAPSASAAPSMSWRWATSHRGEVLGERLGQRLRVE